MAIDQGRSITIGQLGKIFDEVREDIPKHIDDTNMQEVVDTTLQLLLLYTMKRIVDEDSAALTTAEIIDRVSRPGNYKG